MVPARVRQEDVGVEIRSRDPGRGIYLTGYLTETQFNDIKAIFTAFTKEGSK